MAYQRWTIPGTDGHGRTISIEKENKHAPYVATLWEKGIPITRRPIPDDRAQAIIAETSAHKL
jgi:hypothetical protein